MYKENYPVTFYVLHYDRNAVGYSY